LDTCIHPLQFSGWAKKLKATYTSLESDPGWVGASLQMCNRSSTGNLLIFNSFTPVPRQTGEETFSEVAAICIVEIFDQ
jgi:hypothetical protein